MAFSMLKIRRPLGCLIFNMGIAIPGKTVFLIETAPCSLGIHAIHSPIFFKATSPALIQSYDCPKLDMSTARQHLKSPRSLSGTSAHPTMVTQVNIMVMIGWLTSFSFIVNWSPHSWDKAISDSDLETPRSRSWVWSKGKVIQSAQYHIDSLLFHFTSIRPTIPKIAISKFDLETSNVKVTSDVKGQCHILYPVSKQCTSFSFHINRTNHSWDMAKIVFDLGKTHPKCLKKVCQNNSFQQNSSEM